MWEEGSKGSGWRGAKGRKMEDICNTINNKKNLKDSYDFVKLKFF